MVSMPLAVGDSSLAALFPGGIALYGFDAGYEAVTSLAGGKGYWIKLPSAGTYEMAGPPFSQMMVSLPASWSIVGSGSYPLDVAALKAVTGNNVLSVFGYAGGYFSATVMEPGRGYWMNLAAPGVIDVSGSPAKSVAGEAIAGEALTRGPSGEAEFCGGRVWVESGDHRQEIQLGVDPAAIIALPPVPPANALDLRVKVGEVEAWQVPRSTDPAAYPLLIQGQSPHLGWDMPPTQADRWELTLRETRVPLSGHGAMSLGEGAVRTEAMLRQVEALPKASALYPNYPNPFNPSTTIRYTVAEAGPVSLTVYNLTGQVVCSLVREVQAAGQYQVAWDGKSDDGFRLASGVYLCEIRAGDFRAVRRMVLMK